MKMTKPMMDQTWIFTILSLIHRNMRIVDWFSHSCVSCCKPAWRKNHAWQCFICPNPEAVSSQQASFACLVLSPFEETCPLCDSVIIHGLCSPLGCLEKNLFWIEFLCDTWCSFLKSKAFIHLSHRSAIYNFEAVQIYSNAFKVAGVLFAHLQSSK